VKQDLALLIPFGCPHQLRSRASEEIARMISDMTAAVAPHGRPTPIPDLPESIELSIVMPCLNEFETVGTCVDKAMRALREHGIQGEVIVADNGSTDGSQALATERGARVVPVEQRGYGSALMGGIEAARGRYIIMGDADDSYDFAEIPAFLDKLRQGHDVVQGCRLPSGGGRILPGAMPLLHRWWGNPMFSFLARRWFSAPIHDVYCGLRGFTKLHYRRLNQQCTGMEFATEMIIKSSLYQANICEVPITLHPDGRKAHAPHLKTFRDGWRTLRFFLMYCPRWLFLVPGTLLIVAGLLAYALAMPAVQWNGITFDVHTLLYGSLAILCGYQSVLFALFTTTFGVNEGLRPPPPGYFGFFKIMNLERGLICGLAATLAGAALLVVAFNMWRITGYGHMDYPKTLRWVVPGTTLLALGFQSILSSFFVSILGMQKRQNDGGIRQLR
jgi:glycosyltransferase involved in cell wall biosynthesis